MNIEIPPSISGMATTMTVVLGVFWAVVKGQLVPKSTVAEIRKNLVEMTEERNSWRTLALSLMDQQQVLVGGTRVALETMAPPTKEG